jgi:hypothetical protein
MSILVWILTRRRLECRQNAVDEWAIVDSKTGTPDAPSRLSVFDGVLTFFAITFRHGVRVLDRSLRAASNPPPGYSPADQLLFPFLYGSTRTWGPRFFGSFTV